jgi:hypothetical protein
MTKADLMARVRATIDRRGAEIIELGETIRRHPELGFKEFTTSSGASAAGRPTTGPGPSPSRARR